IERRDPVLDAHLPGLPRIHRDVAVEPAREHDTGTERVAEAGRQREPALLVDRVLVGADEHRSPGWPIRSLTSTDPHSTPLSPTWQPFPSTSTDPVRVGPYGGDGVLAQPTAT